MKCQLCGKEIEGEPINKLEYIYAMPHYNPTFFLRFNVGVKSHGGIEKAQLCKACLKKMFMVFEKEAFDE